MFFRNLRTEKRQQLTCKINGKYNQGFKKYILNIWTTNKIRLFLVLYNTKYSLFGPKYLCYGPIYFDIHFNVGKY